jgi:PAS domain-containing protein
VVKDTYRVRWTGRQAIVTPPEHIDVSNAGQIREELLSVINRGAAAVIADMTVTLSCDHAGVDAVVRAYQRALASGTQLRLVVTTGVPAAVVPLLPLPAEAEADVQVPGRRAARARRRQRRASGPQKRPGAAAITAAVLRELVDALPDGVALTDDEDMLILANRRLAEMFGHEHAELIGGRARAGWLCCRPGRRLDGRREAAAACGREL